MRKISPFEILFIPLFLLLIVYPVAAIVGNVTLVGIYKTLSDSFFWNSFINTILAATFAALLGVLLAMGFGYYYIFHKSTLMYRLANLTNDLPIALPHTVAGLALLLAFGRKAFGFAGSTGLAFTLFAVSLAMFFVSYPLASRAIASAIDEVDRETIDVSRTLGDTPTKAYIRVVIPLIGEALISALILAFSRSLSEFAAVIMFGGNVPGATQVLASYVFTKVEEGEVEMAVTASAICVLLSLSLVLALRLWNRHMATRRGIRKMKAIPLPGGK
ncbi:ABC transporter permease protein [Methanocella paludicola SANAE]|uniref:ABC transporter permease protein n=1 Tax=Methanocella paludicola (strain DSM 17711 / JCM 13418 / NBRC 101707 / SANAE) TaxID=304371 RepID=D1YZR2_METPS|nr:ABC transporter permease [Methanocella paludicola]BAI61934.1 ABC transporter permease protein [Methanocella paludicola SANAE]